MLLSINHWCQNLEIHRNSHDSVWHQSNRQRRWTARFCWLYLTAPECGCLRVLASAHLKWMSDPCTPNNLFRTQTTFSATVIHMLSLNFQLHCNPHVYNIALFITIFQQSFCHSSNTGTAGAPLFCVLLGWRLLLILTQHFLHVLHNKCESSGRPYEPPRKVLTMPSRLADIGKSVWNSKDDGKDKTTKHWGLVLHFMNNNTFLTGVK